MNLQKFFDELTEQSPDNIVTLLKYNAKQFIQGEYPDEVRAAVQAFVDSSPLLEKYEMATSEPWNVIHEYLNDVDRKENL